MDQLKLVSESFARCDSSGRFASTFYDKFLAKSPEISVIFSDTNFAQQQKLLRATVKVMVNKRLDNPDLRHHIETIAKTHNRNGYDIPPSLYVLWLDALCETISELDPEYSIELEQYWRNNMQPSIDFITSAY